MPFDVHGSNVENEMLELARFIAWVEVATCSPAMDEAEETRQALLSRLREGLK